MSKFFDNIPPTCSEHDLREVVTVGQYAYEVPRDVARVVNDAQAKRVCCYCRRSVGLDAVHHGFITGRPNDYRHPECFDRPLEQRI